MPLCWMPRPAATSSSPPPNATTSCRGHCSGQSIAPSPPWAAVACAAGWKLDGPQTIQQRQDLVSHLVGERSLRLAIRQLLRPMGDLERLAGRAGRAMQEPAIWWPSPMAWNITPAHRSAELCNQRRAGVVAAAAQPRSSPGEVGPNHSPLPGGAPPLSLSEGDLIHDGVDPLLDGLRNQLDDQDAWLSHQEQQERQRSGISNLKLQHTAPSATSWR